MAYPVRSTFWAAYKLVSSRGVSFFEQPSNAELEPMVAAILIREKGYPTDTVVEIDGSDPMAMVLVVEDNGSWELV